MKAVPASSNCVEILESRVLLSVNEPTAREQLALEFINRARISPAAELPLLLNSTDPNVQNALSAFGVDRNALASAWAGLSAAPPLAWNEGLAAAALAHTQKMLEFDQQSHALPGEADFGTRFSLAGYSQYSTIGENVFASTHSVFEAHAAFMIDWGGGPGGVQSPAGHRANILSKNFREIGISFVDGSGNNVGPLLTTQDFGDRFNLTNPILLGVAFNDAVKNDNFYTVGEGLANLTIVATRQSDAAQFTTLTTASGGYSLELPAGTYDVTASGPGLSGMISHAGVVLGEDNVKVDFTPADLPATPELTASFRARSPLVLKPGATPKVPIHITNSGTAAVAGTVNVDVYLSSDGTIANGVMVNSVPVDLSLAPFKSRDIGVPISAPASLAAGNYKVVAVIDSANAIAETNEENNTTIAAGATRVVPPFTNLVPTIGGQPKAKLPAGSTINFSLKLKNKGNVIAAGTVTPVFSLVSLSSPGTVIPLSTVPDISVSIKPGAAPVTKLSLVLPADLAPGTYRLAVTISSGLTTAESTTEDNSATSGFKFTVPATA